jgi:hypothetical protein
MNKNADTTQGFAQVPEAAAQGRIREIYTDFRSILAAPTVNLIYRHMATEPGCLEWSWATLRPMFVSDAIPAAARSLVASRAVPRPENPIPRDALRAAGVDAEAEAAATAVLDAYNHANPMNLIALAVLEQALHGDTGTHRDPPATGAAHTPRVAPVLPSMINPASVDPDTAALLRRLARQGNGQDEGVVPSAYLHLVPWPPLLRLIEQTTQRLIDREDVDGASGAVAARAATLAAGLRRPATGLPPPTGAAAECITNLNAFFPKALSRMIVIGGWLRGSLPS